MSVALVLVRSDLSQVEVPLKHSPEILGRHTDCKVRLPDASVSRQHCEISFDGDKVSIRDLGSSNGTYVNRKRVTQAEVVAGDVVTLGKFIFVLRVNGKPEKIDSGDALEDGEVSFGPNQAVGTPASSSAKTVSMNPGTPKSAAAAKPAGKATVKGGAKAAPKTSDPGDSSVMDFDFLDDEEGPKL
jgi:pSer/pThr/pTyr-binding forkhead associated (FHA) protein